MNEHSFIYYFFLVILKKYSCRDFVLNKYELTFYFQSVGLIKNYQTHKNIDCICKQERKKKYFTLNHADYVHFK